MMSNCDNFEYLTLGVCLDNLTLFSKFLQDILMKHQIKVKQISQMNVVLDELYSNVVNYSSAETFTLGVAVDHVTIALIMKYQGLLFDVTKSPEPDTTSPLAERKIGGLGLFIVKNTVDEFHYCVENNDTNVITIYQKVEK